MKNYLTLGSIGIFIIISVIFGATFASVHNKEASLRTRFEQKLDERKAFFDKMYKIINQKTQVSLQNDSSFRKNVELIMEGRKDSEGTFMKWITESNPNANYSEVSILYQDLSRSIESEREGFFNQEKVIQDIVREHRMLFREFPNNLIIGLMNKDQLEYTPISSNHTDEIFKNNKEDDIKLF